MKLTTSSAAILALLLTAASAQAQMYKWVGPDGKVNYTDTPPPKSAKNVEQKNLSSGDAPDTSNLPFEVAEAVKNSPVTLYTGAKCTPCDDSRTFLNTRGIPFREKTVATAEDIARLRQVSGGAQLPILMIGRNKQTGYEPTSWGAALTAAGYPETNKLPKTYRNAPAEAAAPVAPKPTADNGKAGNAPERAESLPPAIGNAPPGFRF